MIAIYLHDNRIESFDRARSVLAALGEDAVLVSAHPPPLGWAQDWSLLVDSELTTWSQWLVRHAPTAVVVDGPPEHARAVAENGATLVVVATPGGGQDGERGCAYADAAAILAPWPEGAADWPSAWRERTLHLGAVGWRARQVAEQAQTLREAGRPLGAQWHCVAFWPTHAGPDPRERRSIAVETPGWRWTYAPERDLLEPGPVWSALLRAEVAVCRPTSTSIAALAAFEVPGVLVLPERPAAGEEFLAEAAEATAPVLVVRPHPQPQDWPALLARARQLDGSGWRQWAPEPGLSALAGMLGATGRPAVGDGLVPA